MNTTTFENAQVGDKVWCMEFGWGEIEDITRSLSYPIDVYFPSEGEGEIKSYSVDGKVCYGGTYQTLFWDKVQIIAPSKPLPKLAVDTKVLVWDNDKRLASKRYFSHFDAGGRIYAFTRGSTSWSSHGDTVSYGHWELAE